MQTCNLVIMSWALALLVLQAWMHLHLPILPLLPW